MCGGMGNAILLGGRRRSLGKKYKKMGMGVKIKGLTMVRVCERGGAIVRLEKTMRKGG